MDIVSERREFTVPLSPPTDQHSIQYHGMRVSNGPYMTRRAHKKSRAGCLKCKARKVKCGEEKPVCGQCLSKNYECEYRSPERPNRQRTQPATRIVAASVTPTSLSPTSPAFTLDDMRFFHQFLTLAKPGLPAGNDAAWSMDIPKFAHEYDFLMHAMLGLGATHLDCMTPDPRYKPTALAHRVTAIDGLKKKMAQNTWTYGEADAVLATCYSLVFQTAYLVDGLSDFITLIRGCGILTEKLRANNTITAFDLNPLKYYEALQPKLQFLPAIDPRLISMGLSSLLKLKPYLSTATSTSTTTAITDNDNDCDPENNITITDTLEPDFYYTLWNVFSNHQISPQTGYLSFSSTFHFFNTLPHTSFQTLLSPHRPILQCLWAHWIALQLMSLPLSAVEAAHHPERVGKAGHLDGMMSWSEKVWERVPQELVREGCLDFSRYVVGTLGKEKVGEEVGDGPKVLQVDVIERVMERVRSLDIGR